MSGKKAGGEGVEGEDPAVLIQNYKKFCNSLVIPIHPGVLSCLGNEEKYPLVQILIDNEFGPLGPGGTRALMTALMGTGPGMKGGPFKLVNSIRLWRTNVGEEGAAAIAEILRLGGGEIKIGYLELLDDNIGPKGAMAIGTALQLGNNVSLQVLKLDYNTSIGTTGIFYLCRGLRTNSTIRILSLTSCGIGPEGGVCIGDVLAFSKSSIEEININCNRLGGDGLKAVCTGLMSNTKCEKVNIADNNIDQLESDMRGLCELRDLLMVPTSAITSWDMTCNRIGEQGANILVPALGEDNTRIKDFLVDLTLPMDVFQLIFRKPAGKGKKGKKKGGKKKKK